MSPTDPSTGGFGSPLRTVILVALLLFIFHLGRGWARGLVEGNYLIGVFGLIVALAPIVWLLLVICSVESDNGSRIAPL
ncbi:MULTISPECIES: hypothetical protein [Halomicrobium]|uniref:Uncharacterized protein n=1 Tax=Halomicrobium mukohataei TaxID=57705 RepID=A0A4D6KAV8_9EURY|nr:MULTISPECIES: hypothetical protein [Halomicrobium]QCD64252.1 hypothetical protein E5139_00875 [Halomicrobium mukohataei]QFR19058.1 hypothetical protein GBQ70_00875 [Halomicrobium sp. ZPS1]